MVEDDMYNLHYEFSKAITAPDQKGAILYWENILKRGNPFDTEETKKNSKHSFKCHIPWRRASFF